MKPKIAFAALLATAALATPALAGATNGFGVGTSAVTGQYLDIYGGVATSVSAYRMGQDSSFNYTRIGDVAPVSYDNCAATNMNRPGACVASQGGTVGPGFDQTSSTSNSGLAYDAGYGFWNSGASTYANLATGKLGATGITDYYQTAATSAEFIDTLNFVIAGADTLTVTNIIIKFQLDGGLFAPDAPLGTPGLGTRRSSVDDQFSFGNANARVSFGLNGANASYNSPATLTQSVSQNGWVGYSWDSISPGLTQFTGVYALNGMTQTLGIRNYLSAFAASIGSFAYGSTSSLDFVLPSNVTFTSSSGVFLAGNQVGGVPEPASWAMLLIGFGVIGTAMRRRSTAPVAVAA